MKVVEIINEINKLSIVDKERLLSVKRKQRMVYVVFIVMLQKLFVLESLK